MCLIPYSWLSYRRQARQSRDGGIGEVVNLRAVDPGEGPQD